MIAGVGNMFMKDDGFGGAVIKKMMNKTFQDEKLRSMLNKVSQVTPDEIISLHGGFSNALEQTNNNKKE